jgi:hypothetical protein
MSKRGSPICRRQVLLTSALAEVVGAFLLVNPAEAERGGSAATAEYIAKILTAFPNGDHYRASERAFPGLIYFHKTETGRSPRTPEESQKLFAWEHWTVFIPLQHSCPAPT